MDFGRPYLKLTQHLKSRVDSEIDLLSPYSRSIPLVGRREEREELRAWLARDKPISVRVLTGRAGAGKTRLALELCDELFAEGWAAGFVESGELRRFYDKQNLADWGWGRPTLIVLDYAAIHARRLNDWLSELKGNAGLRDRPLRMLLLERHAEAGSGWWQTAFGRGSFGDRAVEKLLDPPEPIALPPLAETAERRAVIAETLEQAESEERPPEVGADPSFDRELGELTWGGEPLFLMMAGLMAKQVGMAQVLSLRRTDLAFELADRELARIERLGGNDASRAMLVHLAAYATLCRGLARGGFEEAAAAEKQALRRPSAGDDAELADQLCEALPGAEGRIDPILPDIIGEAAILRALSGRQVDASAVVLRAFAQAGQQVAGTVIRTAQDFVGAGYEQPLAWLDALGSSVDVDQLMMIADELPQTSLALARHAVRISRHDRREPGEEVDQGRTERIPSLAAAYNNLAIRLSEVGQREAALAPAKEAVASAASWRPRRPMPIGPIWLRPSTTWPIA